jgi:lysophospholipase L1-like esterase
MKRSARLLVTAVLGLFAAFPCLGQEAGDLLRGARAAETYQRIVDLMGAAAVTVPELSRAAAPLVENARQSAAALQAGSTREHAAVLYQLLSNARIYLQIADAVPKPASFAEDARKQFDALRAEVDRLDRHFRASLEAKETRLRAPDRDNLARYREQNQQLPPPEAAEARVVFIGDSIIDGWRLNQFFPGKPYVNRGIGGQISGEILGRMQADVIELRPKAVLILVGTNDLARGIADSAIQDNLTMIAAVAEFGGIKPVFSSLLPVSDHHKGNNPNFERTPGRPPARIAALNTWIAELCRSRGFPYIDFHSALKDAGGQLRADLSDDGLHPNAEGYKIMAPLVEAALEEALRPSPRRRR